MRLENYFFPIIKVVANPNFDKEDRTAHAKAKIDFSGAYNLVDNGHCQVILNISIKPPDEETQIPYDIELVAVGSLSIPENASPEDINQQIPLGGFAILYGAAREFLLSLTNRGPWPAVQLPIHYFTPDRLGPIPQGDAPNE